MKASGDRIAKREFICGAVELTTRMLVLRYIHAPAQRRARAGLTAQRESVLLLELELELKPATTRCAGQGPVAPSLWPGPTRLSKAPVPNLSIRATS